jgi:hypothetical protein
MEDVVQLVESLGRLHDAKILELIWRPNARSLEIQIKDIYVDLEGFPEYPGPKAARFVFSRVIKFDLEVNLADSVSLYDWVFAKSGIPHCELFFSPSGKITVECDKIECLRDA